MKWLKKLLGIKDYRACSVCGVVYDPERSAFPDYCPEHRKPYIERYELQQWARRWVDANPEKANELRQKEEEQEKERGRKQSALYNQMLAGQQAAYGQQVAAQAMQNNLGLGSDTGLGGLTTNQKMRS